MAGINEITLNQIENLKDIELSELLHTLLHCEGAKYIPGHFTVSVPFNITTADAGSDGRAQWSGTPLDTPRLKNQYCVFQNKATDLIPSKCYEEILVKEVAGQPRKLKAEIEKVVAAGGCYILFTNRAIVDDGKKERIAEFRRALQDTAHSNYNTFQIEVYDANEIKDWTNQYINAIIKVQKFNGVTRPIGFRTWDELGPDIREKDCTYQPNLELTTAMSAIQTGIHLEKIYRIHGHSGLGKTRFIYETFRPVNPVIEGLKNLFVYFDAELTDKLDDVIDYVMSHRSKQNGIIVIDNCEVESHLKLTSLIKPYDGLKLVTVGLDDTREVTDRKIKLVRDNQKELVQHIIDEKLGTTHTQSDRDYLSSVCEGYPWMAVKFSEQVARLGLNELHNYPIESLIKKLLFDHSERNDLEYDVIRACSVFSSFGFLDESFQLLVNQQLVQTLQKQMDFIREEIYDGTISDTKFREICHKYKDKDIIERKSVYYSVKPTVLAIHLAASWLKETSPQKIVVILEKLKGFQLDTKFIERLTDLDQIDKAKELVRELWGADGFFGKAEVLRSEWGSLLFRHVVEVNPQETMNALSIAFGQMSIEELRAEKNSRRNLVWALEKLCFRQSTFADAARMMFSFAVAENETWANNATGQFRQLYQLRLAGTETNLVERVSILKWGLAKNDLEYERIAVLAMLTGLDNGNFHRSGGPEKQGSSAPMIDFNPTWQEIYEYWKELLTLLLPIAKADSANGEIARKGIAGNLRILIRDGFIDQMEVFISEVVNETKISWPEMATALRKAMAYEGKQVPAFRTRLETILDLLTPKDFRNELLLKVSKPEWFDYSEDPSKDIPKNNAESLAEKIVADKINLFEFLPELVKGEQRQGFNFGKRLGELSDDKNTFVSNAIEELDKLPYNEQNPEILAGFVLGTKDSALIQSVYSTFLNSNTIMQNAFYLARVFDVSIDNLYRLFELVDSNKVNISYFLNFKYGGFFSRYSREEVIAFCGKINGYPNSNWVALTLLFMYCFNEKDNWMYCAPTIKAILTGENMIVNKNINSQMDSYHWASCVEQLLVIDHDAEFAKNIMQQLIQIGSERDYDYSIDPYLPKIYRLLFDRYFDDTWAFFGDTLLSKNYVFILHINHSIGAQKGSRESVGVLFENPERFDKLLAWCKANPKEAPKRMAHMMPIDAHAGEKVEWHPFAKLIIDNFGADKDVLSNLSANMGTYGSVGSSLPYLQSLYWLTQLLKDHPIDLVRIWATAEATSLRKQIKLEELDNEGELPRS